MRFEASNTDCLHPLTMLVKKREKINGIWKLLLREPASPSLAGPGRGGGGPWWSAELTLGISGK